MKQVYKDYINEKNVSPEVIATCWMIVTIGEGIPMRLVDHSHYAAIEEAQDEGYIQIDQDGRLRLTQKARAFLDTLLFLAREEGEIK